LVKRGGKKVKEVVDASGGQAIAWMPAGGKKIWVQVEINNNGDQYTLIVVEEAAMEQKVEFTAMELAKALNDTGSIALYGILFDTGKATIKPESASALAPVGDMLKGQASLKLEIQGHTDNVGAAAANLKLSQDRAAAVKAYLVQTFGIGADRLTAVGLGDTKPVGDNKTEDGRTKNRRVELVKK
jgi:outer membrane protein OmpA-like peptidoglycan-associated protein